MDDCLKESFGTHTHQSGFAHSLAFFVSCVLLAYKKMVQNHVWATAYNLVALPVAGGLLVRWGVDLPMSVGVIAMSLSTIIVAANAHLLCRLRLQAAAHAKPSVPHAVTNAPS
jgi:hydrogenase/urease accessory protein HupE